MTFMDDFRCILLVLGLTRESELVLGLSIGDLVDSVHSSVNDNVTENKFTGLPEPFISCSNQTGKMPLNVLDVIEL